MTELSDELLGILRLNDREVHVYCSQHGEMPCRHDERRWACVGLEGEGCTAYLTHEEVRQGMYTNESLQRVLEGEITVNYQYAFEYVDNDPHTHRYDITVYTEST